MTELEQIAASVAKALYLGERCWNNWEQRSWTDGKDYLLVDGSNLFSDHWRCACLDWLLERAYFDYLAVNHGIVQASSTRTEIWCPAAEFPARAIHALMTRGKP